MLPNPSRDDPTVIAETFRRRPMPLTTREGIAEGALSVAFAVGVAVLWYLRPPGAFHVLPALVCFVVLVVASRVRIDTPFGFTVPTQLAFVPLLFAMPLPLVPIAVAAATMVNRLQELVAGRIRVSRLVGTLPNAWYSMGPVLVFELAGVAPAGASTGLLIGAFAGQFAVDFLTSWFRFGLGRGMTFAEHVRGNWVFVIDAALTVVGLLSAEQVTHSPIAALAPLPLLALVALFARERRQRLESLIELNTAYRRARDEAIDASNLKSAFLRNVSHEIRTPMNGVMGMNDLLLTTHLDDEQRRFALQVRESSEHMLAVINDLLDISKIESGRVDLDPVDFDLREAVETACAIGDLEAQSKGLMLEVDIDPALSDRVHGDRSRMRQVLINIVGNAVKFTAGGSIAVRLRQAGSASAERVRFEVADTGIGIEPALIGRMFEPFVQADVSTTRSYGGNGLGLAIAKELVELMGGAIGAESVPGAGSLFWFELPLPAAAGGAAADHDRGRVSAAIAERGPRPTDARRACGAHILVVEDSPVNRLVAEHVLERCGFVAHVVNDGREALQALSTQTYDAVLMDCQMPGIDGYEATRELRRRETGGRHTPVIAMTAHAMTGDRERCLEAGMDDYVTKPVRSHTLNDVLRRWVGESLPAAGDDLLPTRTAA